MGGVGLALLLQVCAGAPDSLTNSLAWVEPHPPAVVAEFAGRVFNDLTDGFIAKDSIRWEMAGLTTHWSRSPNLTPWRELPYPGTKMQVMVEPVGKWTRITVTVRLLCRPTFPPPQGLPADLNVAAFVVETTLQDFYNPVQSRFHDATTEVADTSCAPLSAGDRKLRICREILARDQSNLDANVQYALALIHFYRARETRGQIDRTVALPTAGPSTYRILGAALIEERQYGYAAQLYRRGLAQWPDTAALQIALGGALLLEGTVAEARAALEAGIRLGSNDPDAYYALALAYRREQQQDRAIEFLRRALTLYPDVLYERRWDVRTWGAMGHAASLLGWHKLAMSYFERAQSIDLDYLGSDPALREAVLQSLQLAGPQPPAPLPDAP